MFSESNNKCGELCGSNRSKRSTLPKNGPIKTGWTPFYMNSDSPSGTGDHEHYMYYINGDHDRLRVYDSDGEAYTNCTKKAIHVQQTEIHVPWWTLATSYTLLFSKIKYDDKSTYYQIQENSEEEKEDDGTYTTSLKPDYG